MYRLPRLLVLLGSGETSPSMAPVHREVLARLGSTAAGVTILDTPYGFQENAADISEAAVAYFERRLGRPATVASLRRSDGDLRERQAALARLREAEFIFSGPGSPSYALRHWSATQVPSLLAAKLATGGALVLASAAALTAGRFTLPVYEIYKVGADPAWLPGLDLLAPYGLPVAVIPHFDNAEGRGHDTRFCFLGERRLAQLESDMPDDTFVLGIDEHTALILDLESGQATIRGRGSVTVRRHGRSVAFDKDRQVSIANLRGAAFGSRDPVDPVRVDRVVAPAGGGLAVNDEAEPFAPAPEHGRDARVEPLVEALLEARARARASGDYPAADAIRDRLTAIGIELRDSPDGTSWSSADGELEPPATRTQRRA